ncbi:MAG: preprotein translocase subunit SecE [Nitrospinae bacterium]|nr:preprotein translocase subunit SecE [Nitrospinota bacterium]
MSKVEEAVQFLREVRTETRKVTFPKRRDTMATAAAVIVVVILIGIYLGVVDFFLSRIVGLVLQ